MKAILPVMLSGEAEKEYWNLFRGNQEKFRESKGSNRGRFVFCTDCLTFPFVFSG